MARARALTLCLAAGLALAQPAAAASAAKPEAKTDGKPNAAAASAEPLPVDTGPPAPWRLLRALQRLQVQMAQGSTVAQQAQAGLVAELTRGFAAADAALWSDRRNAVAALALLLSGADPRDLRKLHDDGAFGDHASLVAAGLAFAEGRTAQARALLEEIDEADLGRIVAAQVALVAATLAARDDPERANALFDRARLLSPGTLVEETALRRQARLAEERSDETRFMRLAAQYARRYGRSVYASDFHVRLPAALTRIALAGKRDDLEAIEPLLSQLPARARSASSLAVSRNALSSGRLALALAAARRTLEVTRTLDPMARAAALYAAVAGAPSEGPGVLRRLEAWPAPDSREDRELLRAALDVVGQIYIWPPTPKPGARPPEEEPDKRNEALTRAARQLALGEALLERR